MRGADGRLSGSGTGYSDDVWAAVEADWRAGVKPIRQIARDHGPNASTILERAKSRGWPARKTMAMAAAALVSDSVAEMAVKDLAASLGASVPPDDQDDLDALAAHDASGMTDEALLEALASHDEQAKNAMVLGAYARQLARMLRGQQQSVDSLKGCADDLVGHYKKAAAGLNTWMANVNDDPNSALKALKEIVPLFKSLVGAVKEVIAMQRALYGMEGDVGKPRKLSDTPLEPKGSGEGDAASLIGSLEPSQPGSYEDFLMEAERTGVRLC